MFEQAGRLLPGQQLQGTPTGGGGHPHRSGGHLLAAGGGGHEMMGQLGQMRPRIGHIHRLQRLPHPPVQPDAAGGGQTLVQHLADQGMGEPPTTQPSRDRGDDPGRLGLLHQLQQPLWVQAAGRLQHPQVEVTAHHGGDLQDPPAAVGEAAQPLGHHRLDPLRQAGR